MNDIFRPPHGGLVFSADRIAYAKAHREESPVREAWLALLGTEPDDTLAGALLAAFRYRFDDDAAMGEQAIENLARQIPLAPDDSLTPVDRFRQGFALAQAHELLRDHPAINTSETVALREHLIRLTDAPLEAQDGKNEIIESAWLGVVQMAGAISRGDSLHFEQSVDIFKRIIDEEIHPEGYFRHAVKVDPEAESLANQLRGVQALVLMAEMATLFGVDLWRYQNRGVSVLTAIAYTLYYYFYPENWRWNGSEFRPSEGVQKDEAKRLFRAYSSFVEIASPHYDKPLKAASLVLRELRPVSDPLGGGYVTLTHGAVEKPKRRGLFRR